MTDLGLQVGSPTWRAAGAIAFGPAGTLFLADNELAKIVAVDVADTEMSSSGHFDLEAVDVRVGSLLGCDASDVVIADMGVHPDSHAVYLSVQRGRGAEGQPALVRVDPSDAGLRLVSLIDVPFAEIELIDAPSADDPRVDITLPQNGDEGEELQVGRRVIRISRKPIRSATVTDMAYVDGALLVAGLSNEEFASKLRRIPFPFTDATTGGSLEIFHVSHGKWETEAPIRTFVPYDGGRSILASYTCTPVVQITLADLTPGSKTIGRTVAELGAMNQPLDMVSFAQGGEEHLLVANSRTAS